jgi:hypothetical protein
MTTATAGSGQVRPSIALVWCAAAAVGIYIAATVLGGLLDPSYSHLSMHISELTSSQARCTGRARSITKPGIAIRLNP